jgi:hypothetical protein
MEAIETESRIEVLGDRIELLEYTLNAYIDKIDAVATHATRISADRLTPAIERLGQILREGRNSGGQATQSDDAGENDRAHDALPAELVAISARLAALETRIASIPDRIRIAAAPPLPSGELETRVGAQLFAALTALSRQQDGLKSHLNDRLDELEALASQDASEEMSRRLADCETHVARIPEMVRSAAATTLPDPATVTTALDEMRKHMAAMATRQAEANAAVLNRLGTLETRIGAPEDSGILDRLDALDATISAWPDRIAVAAAPPALQDPDAQRGAVARVFAALSALTRQHADLTSALDERLGAIEKFSVEARSLPEMTANAVGAQLKTQLREVSARVTSADAPALSRATQHRDRKLTVSLARIERGLATLAARESAGTGAPETARRQDEVRTARILGAIADLRSEMAKGFAVGQAETRQQAAVHAALAELLAVARRDAP